MQIVFLVQDGGRPLIFKLPCQMAERGSFRRKNSVDEEKKIFKNRCLCVLRTFGLLMSNLGDND